MVVGVALRPRPHQVNTSGAGEMEEAQRSNLENHGITRLGTMKQAHYEGFMGGLHSLYGLIEVETNAIVQNLKL